MHREGHKVARAVFVEMERLVRNAYRQPEFEFGAVSNYMSSVFASCMQTGW